ncbi:hypothetical protein [Halomonas daqiaonensis]|uniref:Uncharacterized protein n=1 Tax=Halomonas daqiaonensis TaxID=650850 RepID=A0A1H7RDM7_9GAMM|nr:hypothetical protein [Halomonas daqiaonensis]SEL58410.1 hypothetical protein SAMN04488129_11260 [Halomonas daqiaonensis]
MPDPHDPRRDSHQNAAWRAAQQWQERARQTHASGPLGGLKLLLTWLLFGVMMIVAMVLGLFFLLIGWAMMPFLRHRMKKRMEQMRAEQAEDVEGSVHYRETRYYAGRNTGDREQQVLEGDYEIKDETRKDTDRT